LYTFLSHACHMSCPPHSTWFDLPSNIWGWVQNMKLEGQKRRICSFLLLGRPHPVSKTWTYVSRTHHFCCDIRLKLQHYKCSTSLYKWRLVQLN
jgi:hypothetical protein